MDESAAETFADHPAPSVGLVTLLIFAGVGFAVAIFFVLQAPSGKLVSCFAPTIAAVLLVFIAIVCFSFWLLYTTYYTLDTNGITVTYGPSTRSYRWEEFRTAYWRKGMFATKIGWPSVTPCVRLTDGIALHREGRWWPLYLTPNDPKAFIERIRRFEPRLTQEMIL